MSSAKNTQDKIIISAKKLFSQHNFAAVSMSQIAADVGIKKASLYYFFRDKQSLYEAVIEDLIKRVGNIFAQAKPQHGFATIIEKVIQTSVAEGSLIMYTKNNITCFRKEQEKKMLKTFKKFLNDVENFLETHKIEEPKIATQIMLSSIQAYVRGIHKRCPKTSPKQYSQYLEKLFLNKSICQ